MVLYIEYIDFRKKQVVLAAAEPFAFDVLPSIVSGIKAAGYSLTHLLHEGLDLETTERLAACVDADTTVLDRRRYMLNSDAKPRKVFTVRRDTYSSSARYQLSMRHTKHTLSDVHDFSILLCRTLQMPDQQAYRLRFCLHELTSNTVQHAVPSKSNTDIEIVVNVDSDINVEYADNAGEFSTHHKLKVQVSDHIERREKRGLGLSMINSMIPGLAYSRRNGWNITTFGIMADAAKPTSSRRSDMTKFSVELPTPPRNSVCVLRPVGSLDSETTPQLEEYLTHAIEDGRHHVVIDFSKTDFVSSAGIGLMLGTVEELREKGGDLVLMAIPPSLKDIFELMSVEDFFQIISDLSELGTPVTRS